MTHYDGNGASNSAQLKSSSELPYDPSNKASIISYAMELVGTTLREHVDVESIADPRVRKGAFGNVVEWCYFKYEPNSSSDPDFEEVGLELKTTPLKRVKKGKQDAIVSKERLVISMINYNDVVNETFETSSFLHKAEDMLLIFYLYDKEKDPLDYIIDLVVEWGVPDEDIDVFRRDWEIVVEKVRAGKAHEISGSDTLYLEACTKASDSSKRRGQPFSNIPAKPRAWAIKASYMTAISNKLRGEMEAIKREAGEESLDLLELVRGRFAPLFGKTEQELGEKFGWLQANSGKQKPKNLCALITKKVLGVGEEFKIAEFEKAGITPKTIRLKRSGRPKEAVSFPAFKYSDLIDTEFEHSDFYRYLTETLLFVLYEEDPEQREVYKLADVMFWQMPEDDLEEARACYEEMQRRVREGCAWESVKSSENRCCHVRPHGRDSRDTVETPYGEIVVKKCFWLNTSYLKDEIARVRARGTN